MYKTILILVLMTLTTAGTSVGNKFEKIQILSVGQFHGEEISAKTGETWYGLYQSTDGYRLRSFRIRVNQVNDPIVDDEGERTGKQVSVDSNTDPVFLVKGTETLKERLVLSVFEGEANIGVGYFTGFSVRGSKYYLQAVDGKSDDDYLPSGSKLVLSIGEKEQVIETLNNVNDPGWTILWAGDLDNDGKLDLYLDLSDHYNVSDRVLFLSTKAKRGELVGKVANFRTVGC